MRNLLEERRLIQLNEGYFNNVDSDVNVEDIEQQNIKNDIDITEDETKYEFYFDIHYHCHNKARVTDGEYNINIKDLYDRIVRVFDFTNIIDEPYYCAYPILYDANNYCEPHQFVYPLPEKWDVNGYYDSVNGNKWSMQIIFSFRIYFNTFHKCSFETFSSNMTRFHNLLYKMFMKDPDDGGSWTVYKNDGTYAIPMVYHKDAYVWEASIKHANQANKFINMYRQLFQREVADDAMAEEQFARKALDKLDMNYLEEQANTKAQKHFNTTLKLINYSKAKFENHWDVFTWMSFDVTYNGTNKDISLFDVERCISTCVMGLVPMRLSQMSQFIIFLRVNNKLSIPKDVNDNRNFNIDTIRQYQSSTAIIQKIGTRKKMPKIRKCWYKSGGSSHEFIIIIGDKKGNIMKDYENFNLYYTGRLGCGDIIRKCLGEEQQAWK